MLVSGEMKPCNPGMESVMKRRTFLRQSAALSTAVAWPVPLFGATGPKNRTEISFFHTNDTHAHLKPFQRGNDKPLVGGIAHLASLIAAKRKEYPNSLLLSAGDVFQGTLFYNFFKGEADFKCMNHLGYDAMCLGNHEFDDYQEILLRTLGIANFPVLSANLAFSAVTELNQLVQPYVIRDVGGVKVGIIGLTTDELTRLTNPKFLAGVVVNDCVGILHRFVAMIRDKVDLVVVLSHIGLNRDLEIAATVDGVDLVIGGHSHVALPRPVVVESPLGKKVIVNQAGEWTENLGMVRISWDHETRSWEFIEGGLLPVRPEDGLDVTIGKIVGDYDQLVSGEVKRVIGRTDSALVGTKQINRTRESNLGNLIADAIKTHYKADIGLCNGGGIRASIYGPDITIENVLEAFPFDNLAVVLSLKGEQIVQAFRHVSREMQGSLFGGFLHVSGLKVVFDKGELAEITLADGSALESGKLYQVAMSDFMAAGGDGFLMFKDVPEFLDGSKINDLIIEFIESKGSIDYKVEGRIVLR